MQVRLTVLGPRGGQALRSCDVLVTAPAGTALAAVASGLAAAVAAAPETGDAGPPEGGHPGAAATDPGSTAAPGSGQGSPASGHGSSGSGPSGSGFGHGSSGSSGSVVFYAGAERLDSRRCALGEPPLVDGAVLSLNAPVEPGSHPGVAQEPVADAAARLHVAAGPDAGGVHLLHGGQIRIGRSADADVPLDDPDVSRLHCAVTVADGGVVTVADLGSTNGTALDGSPVDARPRPFAPGAQLRIGESVLRLESTPPAARDEGPLSRPPVFPGSLATAPDGEGHLRILRRDPGPAATGSAAARPGTSHPLASHPVPSAPAPSHPVSSAPVSSAPVPSDPIPSDPGTSRPAAGSGPFASGGAAGGPWPGPPGAPTASGGPGDPAAGWAGEHHPGDAAPPPGVPRPPAGTASPADHGAADDAEEARVPGQRTPYGVTRPTTSGEGFGPYPAGQDPAFPAGAGTAPAGPAGRPQSTPPRGNPLPPGLAGDAGPAGGTHGGRQLSGAAGRPVDTPGPAGQRDGRTGRGISAWARRLAGGGRPAARPAPEEAAPPERDPYERPAAAEAAEANRRWPDPSEILLTALGPGPRLWERGPGHPDALVVRLGTADRRTAPAVPVTVDLRRTGSLGLAGPRARLTGLARSVIAQLAALHSPADLELVLISTDRGRDARQRIADWSWLGWLPQLRPAHGQDCRLLLGYDREQATARIAELVRRLDEAPQPGTAAAGIPAGDGTGRDGTGRHTGPYTVMVVDGDPGSASLREATVRLAASGRSVGIHLICLVETPAASPTAPLLANFEAARAASPAFGECGTVAMLSGDVATALRVIHLPTAPQRGHSASGAGPTTSGTGTVRPDPRARPAAGPAGAADPAAGTGRGPGPYEARHRTPDSARPAHDSPGSGPLASGRLPSGPPATGPLDPGAPASGQPRSGTPGGGPSDPYAGPGPVHGGGHPPHGGGTPPAYGSGGPASRPEAPDNGTGAVADSVSGAWAERFARSLAPLRGPDAGTGPAGPGGSRRVAVALPRSARLLDELGLARTTPASLTARWAAAADAGQPAGGRLPAVLGAGPHGPLTVDVAAEGPHLLIEGGPGTGKTELLRALAASLAAADRPDRLALLLVDGGGVRSSLPEPRGDLDTSDGGMRACTDLPHVSTYLPGVDPVRMRAFAQALSSELKRRAQLFGELDFTAWHDRRMRTGTVPPGPGRGGAGRPAGDDSGDLEPEPSGTLQLRARRTAEETGAAAAPSPAGETGPGTVPRLVVLVDDFDALLAPALGSTGRPAAGSVVRALESVARHGARLGVHLIASSGRPERTAETAAAEAAGLRVALEVLPARTDGPERADAAPGRGRLTRRDGTVTPFQAGRVTGRIPRTATQRPTVVPLEWDRMGDPPARRPVRELGNGPTDLALLASALQRAARSASAEAAPPLV